MQEKKLFAITARTLQLEHVVSTINSRTYEVTQFEKLSSDLWLVVFRGSELIHLAKSSDLEVNNLDH